MRDVSFPSVTTFEIILLAETRSASIREPVMERDVSRTRTSSEADEAMVATHWYSNSTCSRDRKPPNSVSYCPVIVPVSVDPAEVVLVFQSILLSRGCILRSYS